MKVLLRGDVLSLNLALMLLFFGMTLVVLFVSTFAQTVLSMSIQDSGTILTPRSITMFLSSIVGGILIDKFGHKLMMVIGGLIMIVVMLANGILCERSHQPCIVLVISGIVLGIGVGGAFSVALHGGHAGCGTRCHHGHHGNVPKHRRHGRPGSRRIFPQRGAATYRDLWPGVHRHIHSSDSSSDHNISADSLLCRPDTKSHIADHPASRSRVNFRD